MSQTLAELQAQIVRFEENENRADIMVNAPNNEASYQTRTGKGVETYPHLIARLGAEANGILSLATAQADRAEDEADLSTISAAAAATSAAGAAESALQAENAAAEIPGFAENAYAVFALKYSQTAPFTLEAWRSEPAEDVYADDYLDVSVLPSSCLLSVEEGRVKLHIPFTSGS